MFYPKSYFFCYLKPHSKFRNPTITPSWRKETVGEEKREREKKITNKLKGARSLSLYEFIFNILELIIAVKNLFGVIWYF